jgi:hypothetical protein
MTVPANPQSIVAFPVSGAGVTDNVSEPLVTLSTHPTPSARSASIINDESRERSGR